MSYVVSGWSQYADNISQKGGVDMDSNLSFYYALSVLSISYTASSPAGEEAGGNTGRMYKKFYRKFSSKIKSFHHSPVFLIALLPATVPSQSVVSVNLLSGSFILHQKLAITKPLHKYKVQWWHFSCPWISLSIQRQLYFHVCGAELLLCLDSLQTSWMILFLFCANVLHDFSIMKVGWPCFCCMPRQVLFGPI